MPMNDSIQTRLKAMQGAASSAFDKAYMITGREPDKELAAYKKLQQNDFNKLTEAFGAEAVVDYVKNMEAKKMQRKIG